MGEPIQYTLETKTVSEAAARDVVIKDTLQTKGATLVKDSIRVKGPDGKDRTKHCKIKAKKTGFYIETGLDLKKDQVITVTYTVKASKDLAGKKLKNLAIASASNTPDSTGTGIAALLTSKDKTTVTVETPQTGDHMPLGAVVGILILSGLFLVGYVRKQRKKQQE